MFERCLYFNVNSFTRKVNKIWDEAFQSLGLSPAHAYLLRLVLEQPGLTQKEIAAELNLEKSTITRFVDVLEDRGYLQRKKNGREQVIFPTTKAQKIERELNEKGDELYQAMIANIGKDKLITLVNQIRKTNGALSKSD